LIDQIMMNLLDNAIKYSPDGGQIEVELEELNDRIKVSVKDNGIGIPPQDIPRVFERFYRVDKARSRKTGGTGLGLSIVKHALDKLNGQVTVESTEGRGSLFSFSLPK
ncbi:MAG: ATP-binding protein, partial [Syntrophomonas sp.]|nr:ATP-binding protein [Syntrophomonas sp.]